MKHSILLAFLLLLTFLYFRFPYPVFAECGVSPEIGCKYHYCTPDGVEWGARHSCYPMPKQLCEDGCDDCQGPNGDRCGGKPIEPENSPTPEISPTPTITPTPTIVIQFMGVKLGRIQEKQPLDIFWDFIRRIIGL